MMQNKPMLYGIIGFLLGGLIVSIAAVTFDKANVSTEGGNGHMMGAQNTTANMSMEAMAASLKGKTGDDYDKTFLNEMIAHHEGALAMAKLSGDNAKHDELKSLSKDIIAAQEKEIIQMRQWQIDWGYKQPTMMDGDHGMMGR